MNNNSLIFEQELAQLKASGLLRTLNRIDSACGPRVMIGDRQVIALCSNDYLGLASHPVLNDAVCTAMKHYGFGSGASRLVSGNVALHEDLEHRIARFKGTEAALLFNSGYAANTGVIPVLAGEGDAIFSDRLNHASIVDGCRLSKAKTFVYRHSDMDHLETLLQKACSANRKLIVTDGVFSMDGDLALLPELVSLSDKYDALLMVDDAHGTGVLGDHGKGIAEHFGLENRIPIHMGTLGKALGSFGAYVAGDRGLIQYLSNTARSFMFSTALPPAACAASIAALDILEQEPERRERLRNNRDRLASGLASLGISMGNSVTPILPIIIGDADQALKAAARLREEGVYAPAIRPPTVPANTSRIRTTVMATHNDTDIDFAIKVFAGLQSEGLFNASKD
jgi:8-amino-7-oxononanoate synthase